MLLVDLGSGHGYIGLEFQTPIGMLLFEAKEQLLNVATCFTHGDGWRDADIQEQVRLFRRAAGAPGMAAANPAQIHDRLLPTIGGFLFPDSDPVHDGIHQCIHATDGIHFFPAFAECGMHVDAGAGDAHPHGAEMLEHDVHVRGLTQDAHIRQDAVVDQIVGSEPVAAIFLAFKLAPLRLFDLARNRGDDYVPFELHSRAQQSLDRMRVANQGALHVVDAEAVDEAISYHRARLVAEAGQELFAAGIRSVHMAVEHQVLAAAAAGPAADHIGAALFDLLPGNVQAQPLEDVAHVLRHLQLFAGGTRDVDHIARHRDDLFLLNFSEDALDYLRIEA